LNAEAIAAVNRLFAGWFKRNLGGMPTACANSRVHFSPAAGSVAATHLVLAGSATCRAPCGLVGKTFFRVKFLFTGGKYESFAALLAA
jgi:hypothetical protein